MKIRDGAASRSVIPLLGLSLALSLWTGRAPAADAPAPPASTAPQARGAPASPAAEEPFSPLDLPGTIILPEGADTKSLPWILVVDDPQCPYCMQLHLALEKSREAGDAEISRSVVVRLPFPLPIHDQSAHIVTDAFCLDASGPQSGWSADSYLDWLIVEPWKSEPGWSAATIDDIQKDGGFFDSKYPAHRVASSRRREFQTEAARAQAACRAGGCRADADCEKLCATETACRSACPTAANPAECLNACTESFVGARYRQLSRIHSACLLEEGPQSAHGKTGASFAWAIAHKIPGTPTIYVGHPAIGFRLLGDSDDLKGSMDLIRRSLAGARFLLAGKTPPG